MQMAGTTQFSEAPIGATSSPMRILLIEDDNEAASYLVKALREAGHVADRAADGDTGFNLADTQGYDCLLYTSPSPRDLSTSRMPSSA